MGDDDLTVRMIPEGSPDDVPETPEERARLARDYLRLIAENPGEYVAASVGPDDEPLEEWVVRAAYAADVIDSLVLFDPTEAGIACGLDYGSWREIRDAVEADE